MHKARRWLAQTGCRPNIGILVVCAMGVAVLAATSLSIRWSGATQPVSPAFFGMHIHHANKLERWPTSRFAGFRLWDAAVSWEKLEPTRGQWDFSRLDELVRLALANNVEPMLTLGITPRWASSQPGRPFVYGLGGNAPPRDMADWENYVRTVATRYKGKIRHYELWNEPTFAEQEKAGTNGGGFYAGSVDDLVEMGRIARRVIKEVSAENQLLSPGFTGDGERLDLFLKRGGREITDIVAYHFYESRPETIPWRIQQIRKVMQSNGMADHPLWDTETGFMLASQAKDGPVNVQEQAAFMSRTHVLAAAMGVERLYYYAWEDLVRQGDQRTMQFPMVTAYNQTLRWLNGATIHACSSTDRMLWICQLSLKGRTAYVVWQTARLENWQPPSEWHALQYETLDAQLVKLEAGQAISIGPSPVLVKTDNALWSVFAQPAAAQ